MGIANRIDRYTGTGMVYKEQVQVDTLERYSYRCIYAQVQVEVYMGTEISRNAVEVVRENTWELPIELPGLRCRPNLFCMNAIALALVKEMETRWLVNRHNRNHNRLVKVQVKFKKSKCKVKVGGST